MVRNRLRILRRNMRLREEFNEVYSRRRNSKQSRLLAGYQSFRTVGFRKTGLFNLLDYFKEADYQVIKQEEDPKRLIRRVGIGIVEMLSSYIIMPVGVISGGLTQNPLLIAGSMLYILANWDGEIKIFNLKKRLKEMGITEDDLFDQLKSRTQNANRH